MTPSNMPSLNNTFEPAPSIKILPRFSYAFRKDIKSLRVSGLKYILVLPPILNQFKFLKF